MILEGVFGGLLGGILRLAPEAFKLFDRKNERKHELEMSRLQIEQLKTQGTIRMDEANAQLQIEEMKAIGEAFKEQGATASASYKWVAAISALVRPVVTWWLIVLYSVVKIAVIRAAMQTSGSGLLEAVRSTYGVDDFAMLNLVLTFWFVGRVWERQRS